MLKVFRDNLKYLSWVLWLVIAVFILFVFVDFGGTMPDGTGAPTEAAVTVGGEEISWGEFQRAYQGTEAFYRQIYGDRFSNETAQQLGLPLQVLNGLIADKILLAEADQMGLAVTDAELREQILASSSFQDDNGSFIGQERYQDLLRRNGWTVESYETDLRKQLLSQKVRTVLSENLFVPDSEVEKTYRDQVEKAKIRFVKISSDDLTDEVQIGAGELETFFAESQEDFRVPEQRVVDYLLIDRLAIQNSMEVGAEEVRAYYDENSEDFTQEEQARARHILIKVDSNRDDATGRAAAEAARQRLDAGADFAQLAAELSEDPGSASRGGDLGFFGRGAMVKPFEDAVFGAAVGDLLGPIKTGFGYHVIEVQERRAGGLQPLTEVESRIRQTLAAERSGAEAEAKATELADRIRRENISPEGWAELAATEVGVSFETSEPFGRDDFVTGIGRSTAFGSRAFDIEPQTASEPISIGRGWAILQTKTVVPPRLPELEEVSEDVRAALLAKKKLAVARDRARSAAADLEQGKDFEQVAAALGSEAEETPLFGVSDSVGSLGRNKSVAEAVLARSAGQTGGPVELEDGAVLFEVIERETFDPVKFEEEKASARANLKNQRFEELMDSLVAQRRDGLKIHLDPALLENFNLPAQGSETS